MCNKKSNQVFFYSENKHLVRAQRERAEAEGTDEGQFRNAVKRERKERAETEGTDEGQFRNAVKRERKERAEAEGTDEGQFRNTVKRERKENLGSIFYVFFILINYWNSVDFA